jgi:8-oxo-dGTP pyrophosphatase MutT (NUDIX family)
MSFLDRFRSLDQFDPSRYVPFCAAGLNVGLVVKKLLPALEGFPETFEVSDTSVSLADKLSTPKERTEAVDGVLRRLAVQGWFPGWRDEPYPVAENVNGEPLFEIERAAVPFFGIRACGVHVNGYVRDGKNILMWVGRRSKDKGVEPGKLDQIVAGGRHAGLTAFETLIKEAQEEADLPGELAETAVSVGAITYRTERPEGLRRDVLYIYDLELPSSFTPRNTDGEIDEFHLWPLDTVIDIVRESDSFKFNCALVVIDFLVRHGRIQPDHPDYLAIIRALHRD